MKFSATHQAACNVSRLQHRALSWRMGSQITSHSDQDVTTCTIIIPFAKLPDTCLEHLVGMKSCVFAQ